MNWVILYHPDTIWLDGMWMAAARLSRGERPRSSLIVRAWAVVVRGIVRAECCNGLLHPVSEMRSISAEIRCLRYVRSPPDSDQIANISPRRRRRHRFRLLAAMDARLVDCPLSKRRGE